jgi:phage-related minor tail protein
LRWRLARRRSWARNFRKPPTVEETQSLLDKLTVASQASGVSVTGLAGNLETFGPILKNAGFTVEESTAIFANLEAAGIGVTRVMPAMNMAIRKLADEGVTDIKGALLGQIEAIKEATTTTEALNIATALFGATPSFHSETSQLQSAQW